MSVDPVVSLLIGALGASIIGLLGGWVQSRREHTRWLREQRLAAYAEYVGATDRVQKSRATVDKSETLAMVSQRERAEDALASIELLGPDRVLDAALNHTALCLSYQRAVFVGSVALIDRRTETLERERDALERGESPIPAERGHSTAEEEQELGRLRAPLVSSKRVVVAAARRELGIRS